MPELHLNISFKELYASDINRYGSSVLGETRLLTYYLRKAQTTSNKFLRKYYDIRFQRRIRKHGIEISYSTKIGKGFYLGHPYGITINPAAVIGDNVNIHKGVTIGQENRGARCGAPTIGNCVWIGVNATVVGNIRIGNDVLIAPNTYVNCDVPDHSVVFGNPCVIKFRENATEGYINNLA